jgi:hypothetical protein
MYKPLSDELLLVLNTINSYLILECILIESPLTPTKCSL